MIGPDSSRSPTRGHVVRRVRGRRGRAPVRAFALAAVILAAPVWGRPAAAQEEAREEFTGRERVTAVDLLIEAAGAPSPAALEVTEDGERRPVVSAEGGGEAEPWRLVVWFELPLAEPDGVRWAADALSARAAELVELGAVEVVVADPEPRTVLPPARDAEALAGTLAGIAGNARAGDELVRLRRAVARELADAATADAEAAGLARTAAREEVRFVAERADALLVRMVETAAEPGVGSRRALLLVTSGWDLDPAAFYRARLDGGNDGSEPARTGRRDRARRPDAAADGPPEDVAPAAADGWPEGTGAATEALARTLAAYGWVTLALVPPVPVEPEWHLRRRAQVSIDQSHRPEAGEAFLELARALAAQGELERAIDTYRDAIHAFYDHPASAPRQAIAEAELGDLLARMERPAEAERWWRRALARDPSLAARYPGAAAALAAPREPLATLAAATSGRVVRDDLERPGALDSALDSLEDRVRITYQRPGAPDGGLHPVSVRLDGRGRRLPAPSWSRSGTPETVAAARLRRLLATGEAAGATLAVTVAPAGEAGAPSSAADGRAVPIRLYPPAAGLLADPDHQPVLRVSLAALAPDGDATVLHRQPDRPAFTAGEPWTFRLDAASLPPGHQPAAVLVEDLVSGEWGAAVVPR